MKSSREQYAAAEVEWVLRSFRLRPQSACQGHFLRALFNQFQRNILLGAPLSLHAPGLAPRPLASPSGLSHGTGTSLPPDERETLLSSCRLSAASAASGNAQGSMEAKNISSEQGRPKSSAERAEHR